MTKPKKYATLALCLTATLTACEMPLRSAQAETYSCYNGTFVDFELDKNLKVQSYTIKTNDPRRRYRDVVHIERNKYNALIVRVNGKPCEIPE